jgi:hypothetical protein
MAMVREINGNLRFYDRWPALFCQICNENERIFSYVSKDSLFYMSRLQSNMHISKHSYCLANGYKLNTNYTEVLYSLWDVLFGFS